MDFILYPFAWLLRILYEFCQSYGFSLILFALVIKLVLLYFSMRSKKGMMKTARLQPKLKELEKRYAGNKEKYNEETQKLYKDNDVKMMSGCVWSLIPLPILLALYNVIREPLTYLMQLSADQINTVASLMTSLGYAAVDMKGSYGQITLAQQIFENYNAVNAVVPGIMKMDFTFFGLNLAAIPDYKFIFGGAFTWSAFGLFLIPIISALLAYVSTKISMLGSDNTQQQTMKSMTLMAPVMSLWIGFIMPAGLGIYWIATSVFAMIQDYILAKYYTKVLDREDAARLERQRALEEDRERKRLEYERLKAENANTRNKNTSKKKVQKVERLESEKKEAEFEKKKISEKGVIVPEIKIDESRPYARGRAVDAARLVETKEPVKPQEAAPAPVDPEQAAKEAERKDKDAFEKFLVTGKIEDDSEDDAEDNA
jgi:YidC/Oxa1 family membrane protein insertase